MKRLALAVLAVVFCTSAFAGGRGYNHGGHYNNHHYGGHYNGWAIAGAAALGFWGGYAAAQPYYGGYPQYNVYTPYYAPPPPPVYYNYPPQQVVICVQSGNSQYYQQGNCFTPQYQYPR